MKILLNFFFLMTLIQNEAKACKAFAIHHDQQNIVGKSFDFDDDAGAIFINKRNMQKTSFTMTEKKASWVSKYGSITLNQAGQEFPFSGMNEAGLVIEILWLDETQYPKIENPSLNESQFIQYLLDTSANTTEALTQANLVSIAPTLAPVHYFICDTFGACAVLEFLNGQSFSYLEMNHDISFISNTRYEKSRQELATRLQNIDLPHSATFEKNKTDLKSYSFSLLERLKTVKWTQWQIVYDQNKKEIQLRTESNQEKRHLQLQKFDFSCQNQTQFFDLTSSVTGDLSNHFQVINTEKNYNLIQKFKRIPPPLRSLGSKYPSENIKCLE